LGNRIERRENVDAGSGDRIEALGSLLSVVQHVFKVDDWSYIRQITLIVLQHDLNLPQIAILLLKVFSKFRKLSTFSSILSHWESATKTTPSTLRKTS
jgi:hypothetical protein